MMNGMTHLMLLLFAQKLALVRNQSFLKFKLVRPVFQRSTTNRSFAMILVVLEFDDQ